MPEIEKLYNTLEAAALLKCGSDTIRAKIRAGNLSCRKIGGRYFFSVSNINEYLAGTAVKAKK
jgi:excisionase family DNA binding protein